MSVIFSVRTPVKYTLGYMPFARGYKKAREPSLEPGIQVLHRGLAALSGTIDHLCHPGLLLHSHHWVWVGVGVGTGDGDADREGIWGRGFVIG